MSFGESLRKLRRQAGLTQTALAQVAGLSLRSVQNWEQGHRVPRLDTLLALTKGLGVPLDRLIEQEGLRKPILKQSQKSAKQLKGHRVSSQTRRTRLR